MPSDVAAYPSDALLARILVPLFGGPSRDCGPEFLGVQRGEIFSCLEAKQDLQQC